MYTYFGGLTMHKRRFLYRIISIAVALSFLFVMGMVSVAQDGAAEDTTEAVEEVMPEEAASMLTADDVQSNLDQVWILVAGFLVFFMQAGFAMLEGGFIRHTGVVNSLAENFMDACITGLAFFIIGYGIAYAGEGSLLFGTPVLALGGINGTAEGDGAEFVSFFFQFAFAGAAGTIATGAMSERTDFRGKLIYSAILGAFLYPIVVYWTWGGGILSAAPEDGGFGFLDFAGSTIVHQFGGIIALVGAIIVGPRVGRVFGNPPRPSNLGLAALGTFILWFGWYGFNVGSTLGASDQNALGLVAVNTTLAAAAGSVAAMFFVYFTKGGKWDLGFILNGSLAGLVGITAGCAFVSPIASIIIGITAGIAVVLAVDIVEAAKVDDGVGAFAVHGVGGMIGSLAIGFWGLPELTGTAGGLLVSGDPDLLISQIIGVVWVAVFAVVTGTIMFGALKALGLLRMPAAAETTGIDVHEHGASVWPDILPLPEEA
ncbi:ammonium transporter [Phototrophicus methaneseepsis]|uniref:Ammonium transporter n=2 Tax=Phototrophicus methaneseepsis TaxID=2710758 RepID=A0A7S8ECP3_9CHLR|nr:ammonium transporter [Phototrophicus methaneseepsis]